MIHLEKISIFELRDLVTIAYEGDTELLEKYHVDEYSLEEAVNMTMGMIRQTSEEAPMEYFSVMKDNEPIGYLCILPNFLYSFGIKISERTKETLSEFWGSIISVLGKNFICMLYPNNTRAIGWLERCGMKIISGVENNCTTLLNI